MKSYHKYIIIIIAFISYIDYSYSQSLQVLGVDYSKYPTITAEINAYDKSNSEVRNYNNNEVFVTDGGVKYPATVYCPPPSEAKFSVIIVIDRSGSMMEALEVGRTKTKMQAAREAVTSFISSLPYNRFECALLCFSGQNYLLRDFTNDKEWLLKAIISDTMTPIASKTDFNAAFLWDQYQYPGALRLKNKYTPFIIFLTDGQHHMSNVIDPIGGSRDSIWVERIYGEAKKSGHTIYALSFGFTMPSQLVVLSTYTGGQFYADIPTQERINEIYYEILMAIQGKDLKAPCQVSWNTNCNAGNATMEIPKLPATDNFNYTVPKTYKPYLSINPRTITILNNESTTPISSKVVITAKQNYCYIDNKTISNNNFTVTDWGGSFPFTLKENESRTITIKYTPSTVKEYIHTEFNLLGFVCDSSKFYADISWIFANDINMGTSTIYIPVEKEFTEVFCNKTAKDITISNISIVDNDYDNFEIINPPSNYILKKDSCLILTFRFTPSSADPKKATLKIIADGNTYTSKIYGLGSGKAIIEAVEIIDFDSLDCNTTFQDMTIKINNPGALDLHITNFELDNKTDFRFIPNNPNTLDIQAGESKSIILRFKPTTPGLTHGKLIITSDAGNSATFVISLSGYLKNRDFTLSANTIKFGINCPDTPIESNIEVQNDGNVSIDLDISVNPPFSVSSNQLSVSSGAKESITVTFDASIQNTYNEVLTITEKYCNVEKKVDLFGEIDPIILESEPMTLISTVGSYSEDYLRIYNRSKRTITISDTNFQNPQFQLISPLLSIDIPSNSYQDFKIRYTASDAEEILNSKLTFLGNPCNFEYTTLLSGMPYATSADIQIANYSAMVGQEIEIKLDLINTVKLEQSGTTSLNTIITYDPTLLQPIAPTIGNNGVITLTNLQIIGNNDQTLAKLHFLSLNSSNDCCDLKIESSTAEQGYLKINKLIAGKFCLLRSSGTIEINQYTAEPGEIINIPIKLYNKTNISDFHESINTTIKFNAYILEPIGTTPIGQVIDGNRVIELSHLQLLKSDDDILTNITLRAMLGNVESTDIIIENTNTTKGLVDFQEIAGQFTLKGICIDPDGSKRLFNPFGNTLISQIKPNPSNSELNITLETIEEATTELYIINNLGIKVKTIINSKMLAQVHNFNIDIRDLPTGVYWLMLKTPTKLLSKRFDIIK